MPDMENGTAYDFYHGKFPQFMIAVDTKKVDRFIVRDSDGHACTLGLRERHVLSMNGSKVGVQLILWMITPFMVVPYWPLCGEG